MLSDATLEVEMVPDSSPCGNFPAPANSFALRLDDELALRLLEPQHSQEHFSRLAAEREHLGKWFGWVRDVSLESTSERVNRSLQRFARGDGWYAELCWRSEPVGSVWLHGLDGPGGSTEIGYWLAKGHEGRGLMTRTVRELFRHFFEGRGLARVSIGLDPRNERSMGIVKRLGLRPEAILRRVLVDADDNPGDLAMFGLLDAEWRSSGPEASDPLPLARFALEVDAEDDIYVGLFERDDADALAALVAANAEHLRPWMPWLEGHGLAAQLAFIEGRALPAFAAGDGGFEAGIWSRGRLVGAAGVHSIDAKGRSGMIGYWLDHGEMGKGVVTRAVRAIIERSFNEKVLSGGPLERLEIAADVDNLPSRAVAERLGFTFEGVLRRQPFDGKRYIDLAIYSLLRSEFEALAGSRTGPESERSSESAPHSDDGVAAATMGGDEMFADAVSRHEDAREEPTMQDNDYRDGNGTTEEDDREELRDIEEREDDLDDALDGTFPASDPVSQTMPRHHQEDDD